MKHGAAKIALLLVSSALALEGGSYGYLTIRAQRGDIDRFVRGDLLPKYMEFAKRVPAQIMIPHPRLGWYRAASITGMVGKNRYVTESDGARQVPNASGPALVSTYGDSFTEGLEVENDKTWPAQLSYRLGAMVRNYAVSGYGPDQALLNLEENLQKGRVTPIVILAFIPENLNRLVSAFRPFYTYPRTDFVAFKPIFVEEEPGHFETKFFAPAELSADALVRAASEASVVDHWFTVNLTPRSEQPPRFPYFLALLEWLRHHDTAVTPSAPVLPPAPARAKRVMRHIISRLYEDSRKYSFIPVVVALPGDPLDFQNGINNLDEIFSERHEGLLYVDVSRHVSRRDTGYREMFGDTHYSEQANAEVGAIVAEQIRPLLSDAKAHQGPRAR